MWLCDRLNVLDVHLFVGIYPERVEWIDAKGDPIKAPTGISLDGQVATDTGTGQRSFYDVGPDVWVPLISDLN